MQISPWIAFAIAAVSAVAAWFVGFTHGRSRASGAEARVEELRRQVDAARQGFDGLREKLEGSEKARVEAETRVSETEKHLASQRSLLEEAKKNLTEVFQSLASNALSTNNKDFLVLAEQTFNTLKQGADSELKAREKAIEHLVNPLTEAIGRYHDEAAKLESKRLTEIGAIGEQLGSLATAHVALQGETAKLVNALRSPQVRGRWGEIALKKTAELAGMSEHCDFVEQESVNTEDGRLRPDMIVKLPAGREIVVDSKVSLAGFMEALEAKTDSEREAAMNRHATQIAQHVLKLSAKDYWEQFKSAPEFVVLFIPNDSFLAAAAERDPGLIETALAKKIVIATPTTFIALLRAIAYGWRQEQLTENAERISVLGQEVSDRIATVVEYLNDVGVNLRKAVDAYNKTAASIETRLLGKARQFKELGVGGKKEVESLMQIDATPRSLAVSEPKSGRDKA